ncbi:MAG: hypothetical protein IJM54_00875 [Thermoguttaceae bacterium]|nr:hypothetical protein [Thermoguttaceae bacterium]
MNKILAVFRKEYRETRITTLIFLLVGLLFPLIKLGLRRGSSDTLASLLYVDPFAWGGFLAVWLNAAILCATSFARERENGTFETLRRITSDWRVAAVGKFGYALASSLALAAFFYVESLVAAKIGGYRPLEGFRAVTSDFFEFALVFATTTFCWGVFWTGRVSRQMTSIFLTFLCSILITAVAGWLAVSILKLTSVERLWFIKQIVGGVSLFPLVASPFKEKFGYWDNENKDVSTSSENGSGDAWSRVDVQKKSRAFPTLLSLAFTDAAILFKSPISILFELSILSALCAFLYAVDYSQAKDRSIYALLFYFMLFSSGLFLDSKKKDSLVQERLGVEPNAYWFANALAGLVVWSFVFIAFVLTVPYGRHLDEQCMRSTLCALLIWGFGLSLWCAALNASRLVVGAVTFVVFSFATVFGGGVIYFAAPQFFGLENAVFAIPFAGLLLASVFAIASYNIVTRRAINRKAIWSVAIPTILIVSAAMFLLRIRAL